MRYLFFGPPAFSDAGVAEVADVLLPFGCDEPALGADDFFDSVGRTLALDCVFACRLACARAAAAFLASAAFRAAACFRAAAAARFVALTDWPGAAACARSA